MILRNKSNNEAFMPFSKRKYDIGYLIFASKDVTIKANETGKIPLGLLISLDDLLTDRSNIREIKKYQIQIIPYKGISLLGLSSSLADNSFPLDYSRELMLSVQNVTDNDIVINKNSIVGSIFLRKIKKQKGE